MYQVTRYGVAKAMRLDEIPFSPVRDWAVKALKGEEMAVSEDVVWKKLY